jgi:hypothetical protein
MVTEQLLTTKQYERFCKQFTKNELDSFVFYYIMTRRFWSVAQIYFLAFSALGVFGYLAFLLFKKIKNLTCSNTLFQFLVCCLFFWLYFFKFF